MPWYMYSDLFHHLPFVLFTIQCQFSCLYLHAVVRHNTIHTWTWLTISIAGSGNCSSELIEEIVGEFDPLCLNNSLLFSDLYVTASNSTPSDSLLEQLLNVTEGYCDQSCAGISYKLFDRCYPDDPQNIPHLVVQLCSSNGDIYCGLSQFLVENTTNLDFVSDCFVHSSDSQGQCPPGCDHALAAVIDELDCCLDHYFQLIIDYVFTNASIKDFYDSCGIKDPGFCRFPFDRKCQKHAVWVQLLQDHIKTSY